MTIVQLAATGRHREVHITGHAGYAQAGSDIVCAAISALAFTAMAALDRVPLRHKRIRHTAGGVHIVLEVPRRRRREVDTILAVIRTGYALLADKYPAHVKVEGGGR